ncbi:MAG: prepilin-type N-terminal cleavage/methylation domain-containing protein [Wenzhouxiangellaceae bacterium]
MRSERGFTLLEMLLAMVLISLIMAMAYSGFSGALRATRSGERVMERSTDLRAAYQFVHRQLERVLPMAYDSDDEGMIVFEGSRDLIRFVAPMPGYLGSGGPYVQQLTLEPYEDGFELIFRFAILQTYQDGALEENDPVVLLSDIEDGEFRYMGFDDQGQLSDWEDTWETPSLAPTAINLDLAMNEAVQIIWPEMKAAVMVDSSVGGLMQNRAFQDHSRNANQSRGQDER